MTYQIQGMTLFVNDMEAMLDFYMNVFEITFIEKKVHETNLYSGVWSGLNILLCPAELTKVTANQNRHQFDIIVEDIQLFIKKAEKFGGKIIGNIVENHHSKSVGMYDPDGNSILFIEMANG